MLLIALTMVAFFADEPATISPANADPTTATIDKMPDKRPNKIPGSPNRRARPIPTSPES